MNTIYNIVNPGIDYNLKYLLGLMNSALLRWIWGTRTSDFKSLFPKIKKESLASIPIRAINFSDPADVACHDQVVSLVEKMLELHKRLAAARTATEREMYQQQIDTTDKKIDKLVYELYGLTDEEIKLVEGV